MNIPLQVTDVDGLDVMYGGACCIAYLLIFIVWIYVCIWTYRDAEKRGSSGFLWALLVFIFGIIPLVIWLIVRPPIKVPQQYPQQGYGYMPPPPTPPGCPACNRQMAYVPQYGQWYCYTCQRYQQPGAQTIITREVVKIACPYCGSLNDSLNNGCVSCGASLRGR